MSALILWLDTKEARLFHLLPSGVETEKIRSRGPRHPVESLGRNHTIEQSDEEKFYHALCARLAKVSADEWLVSGPGPAREHFMNHLQKHHPVLSQRVRSVQKMERLTDAQIIDEGMKYFRHAHLFQGLG